MFEKCDNMTKCEIYIDGIKVKDNIRIKEVCLQETAK